jgi:hypothetical protein
MAERTASAGYCQSVIATPCQQCYGMHRDDVPHNFGEAVFLILGCVVVSSGSLYALHCPDSDSAMPFIQMAP